MLDSPPGWRRLDNSALRWALRSPPPRAWLGVASVCGGAGASPFEGFLGAARWWHLGTVLLLGLDGWLRVCGPRVGDDLFSGVAALLLGLAPVVDGGAAVVRAGGLFGRAGLGQGVGAFSATLAGERLLRLLMQGPTTLPDIACGGHAAAVRRQQPCEAVAVPGPHRAADLFMLSAAVAGTLKDPAAGTAPGAESGPHPPVRVYNVVFGWAGQR